MIEISERLLNALTESATRSERKRMNHNFHQPETDIVQRMLNAVEPDSYVRPHKHETPDKHEVFIILKGSILAVSFHDNGSIINHSILSRSSGVYGVEIPPGTWHTIIALEPNSVLYELKEGPYDPQTDKKFPSWAPDEKDENALAFNTNILKKLNL
jgi:cupin fold WbuC family metalloprotein